MIRTQQYLALIASLFWAAVLTPAFGAEIYWSETNSDAVFGADVIDGSDQRKIRDLDDTGRGERNYSITGIAFADDFLYFTAAGQDRLYYASTAPGGPRGLFINLDNAFGGLDYRPQGIAANSEHVYWTDRETRSIYRADAGPALNRTGAMVLLDLSAGATSPREITVFGDDLYWTDTGTDAIFRSDLDGNGVTQIIDIENTFGSGSYFPGTITATERHLFWSDTESDTIYRADRDGSNAIELIDVASEFPASPSPFGLVTDGRFLYWNTFEANDILVATLNGDIVNSRGFLPAPDPTVSGFNVNALGIEYIPEPSSLALLIVGGTLVARSPSGRRRVRSFENQPR